MYIFKYVICILCQIFNFTKFINLKYAILVKKLKIIIAFEKNSTQCVPKCPQLVSSVSLTCPQRVQSVPACSTHVRSVSSACPYPTRVGHLYATSGEVSVLHRLWNMYSEIKKQINLRRHKKATFP